MIQKGAMRLFVPLCGASLDRCNKLANCYSRKICNLATEITNPIAQHHTNEHKLCKLQYCNRKLSKQNAKDFRDADIIPTAFLNEMVNERAN
jgi:hypothetical protein